MAFKNTRNRPQNTVTVWTPETAITQGADVTYTVFESESLPVAWGAVSDTPRYVIDKIIINYIGATDTARTSNIQVGNTASLLAHSTFSTPSGKADGDIDILAQAAFDGEPRAYLSEGQTRIRIKSGSGSGSVVIGLVISFDYTDWFLFNPQSPV